MTDITYKNVDDTQKINLILFDKSVINMQDTNKLHEAVILEKLIVAELLKKLSVFVRPESSLPLSK